MSMKMDIVNLGMILFQLEILFSDIWWHIQDGLHPKKALENFLMLIRAYIAPLMNRASLNQGGEVSKGKITSLMKGKNI